MARGSAHATAKTERNVVGDNLRDKRRNLYDVAAQLYSKEGLAASSVVLPIMNNKSSIVPQYFAGLKTRLARQLKPIAFLLEGRAQIGLRRQVFFANQPGYDTHGGQPEDRSALLSELAQALKAFQDAVAALGLANDVTAFTLSEFGRTFKPAANRGTDHGWAAMRSLPVAQSTVAISTGCCLRRP